MTIDSVSGASTASMSAPTPTRAPKQQLDGELFMNLLVTQLKNQDPSSPLDTNEMIGQTTQLAMMEQLTKLGTNSDEGFALQMRTAASSLLGQTLSYLAADGSTKSGIATSISFADAVPVVKVGADTIALDKVLGVQPASADPSAPAPQGAPPGAS